VSVPDASLCAMRLSRAGRPQPYRVGEYDGDVSIYGVRDLAGGTRDWCGGDGYGADPPGVRCGEGPGTPTPSTAESPTAPPTSRPTSGSASGSGW
jgi:hypothetical protein